MRTFFFFFFCSSPNFGRKTGLNLSRTVSDLDLCPSQIFCPPLFKILRTLLDANEGRRPGKLSDSKPEKDCVASINSTGGPKGVPDVTRKFLTRHRKLMGKLTKMQKDFKLCSTLEQFNSCSTNFDTLKTSFASYCGDLKRQVSLPIPINLMN